MTDERRASEGPETEDVIALAGIALVVGAIGYGVYRMTREERLPSGGGPLGPGEPPASGQPGQPASPPTRTGVGWDVRAGDLIVVRVIDSASGTPVERHVKMRVATSDPASSTVDARFEDPELEVSSFAPPMPVDRERILEDLGPGGGGIVPPQRIEPAPPPPAPRVEPPPPAQTPRAGLVYLGAPLEATQGRRYRGRIELGGMQALLANPGLVAGQLDGMGFSDVRAYQIGKLPMDWPAETLGGEDRGTWYIEGTWLGPSGMVPRPAELVKAWEA